MADQPIILNPIGWGQFQLLGGWKRTLGICAAYAGAALLIMLLMYRAMREDVKLPRFASGALLTMILIQTAILVFVGTNAVKRAIQRDFTSDMISSHRMTAMPGYTAVLGYLTGPTIQCAALSVVNWIICTVLAGIAGDGGPATDLLGPTLLFVVMGCMAVFCWSFAILMALCTRGKISVVGAFVVLGILSNTGAIWALPGLAIIVPAYLVEAIKSTSGSVPKDAPIIASMCAQVVLAFTFLLASARKYTRDDVAAFAGPLGYCLLALCALLGAVGIQSLPDTPSFLAPRIVFQGSVHFISTLAALALVAFLPTANAARASAQWCRRKAKDPCFEGTRPRSFIEAVFISCLLGLGILLVVLGSKRGELLEHRPDLTPGWQIGCCAAAFALTLLTIGGLLRYVYAVSAKVGWVLVLFLVVAWCLPMFGDLSLDALLHPTSAEYHRSPLFTMSPVGLWVATSTKMDAPILTGLCIQAGLAGAALLLATRARHQRPASGGTAAGVAGADLPQV